MRRRAYRARRARASARGPSARPPPRSPAGPRTRCGTSRRVIGISTPSRAARSCALLVVLTPSATCDIPASTSRSVCPRPSSMPTVRLRDRSPVQVSTRSPMPASPASVSGLAALRTASREISARPRVMSAARVLWPEAEPVGDAGGDGHDVLERAAELDAGHVVRGVDAEAIGLEQRAAVSSAMRRRATPSPPPSAARRRPPWRSSGPRGTPAARRPSPAGCP